MFAVVITEKGGAQRRVDFDKTEVTIGRVQGNDIILPKGNVSKRHSRIVLKDGRFIVVDLKSTNGTYVNGRKITSPLVVKSGDKIYIGDYILTVEETAGAGAGAPAPMAAPPPMAPAGPPPMAQPPMGPPPMAQPPMGPPPMGPPPMGPPPMGPPPGMPAAPSAPVAQTLAAGSLAGAPPDGFGGPRPPSMRPGGPPPRAPGAPPPLAGGPPPPAPPPLRAPEPEPPSAPADRFNLDEEPADETAPPSPRVVAAAAAPARPRAEPPPAAPRAPDPAPAPYAPAPAVPVAAVPVAPAPAQVRAAPVAAAPAPVVSAAPAAASVAAAPAPASPAVAAVSAPPALAARVPAPGSLGPLEALLEEVGVLEIVVEGPARVLVDRGTGLVGAGVRFGNADALGGAIARLFADAGVSLATGAAVHEATLADGTYVLAVLPPFAVGGPLLEIRRLGRPAVPGETLVAQGMLSADMLATLRAAVAVRRNVVVVGPSDAGVAQLMSALANLVHPDERLLAVEASPELAIPAQRAVRLAACGGDLGALLARAGAVRADRVVIDGVTGTDLRAALVLAGSRSGGTLLGVRAAVSSAALGDLEALASLSGGREGLGALVTGVAHVLVRLGRGADGVRRVESICEASPDGLIELFEYGEGGFASTGQRPSFFG